MDLRDRRSCEATREFAASKLEVIDTRMQELGKRVLLAARRELIDTDRSIADLAGGSASPSPRISRAF